MKKHVVIAGAVLVQHHVSLKNRLVNIVSILCMGCGGGGEGGCNPCIYWWELEASTLPLGY